MNCTNRTWTYGPRSCRQDEEESPNVHDGSTLKPVGYEKIQNTHRPARLTNLATVSRNPMAMEKRQAQMCPSSGSHRTLTDDRSLFSNFPIHGRPQREVVVVDELVEDLLDCSLNENQRPCRPFVNQHCSNRDRYPSSSYNHYSSIDDRFVPAHRSHDPPVGRRINQGDTTYRPMQRIDMMRGPRMEEAMVHLSTSHVRLDTTERRIQEWYCNRSASILEEKYYEDKRRPLQMRRDFSADCFNDTICESYSDSFSHSYSDCNRPFRTKRLTWQDVTPYIEPSVSRSVQLRFHIISRLQHKLLHRKPYLTKNVLGEFFWGYLPRHGLPLTCSVVRQPRTGLLFAAVDEWHWRHSILPCLLKFLKNRGVQGTIGSTEEEDETSGLVPFVPFDDEDLEQTQKIVVEDRKMYQRMFKVIKSSSRHILGARMVGLDVSDIFMN